MTEVTVTIEVHVTRRDLDAIRSAIIALRHVKSAATAINRGVDMSDQTVDLEVLEDFEERMRSSLRHPRPVAA